MHLGIIRIEKGIYNKEITSHISSQLFVKQRQIPKSIQRWDIIQACEDMLEYRYPLDTLDFKKQSLEDIVKKCGFGNLAGMIDFCNNPQNIGKYYSKSVDKSTYNKTMEEVEATKLLGTKYGPSEWSIFYRYANWCSREWKFDLKKMDTSPSTPVDYAKLEKQLKCLPSDVLETAAIEDYHNRMNRRKRNHILESPASVQKYAQDKKGIRLSAKEAQEAYQLGLELIKYGTLLKLVKRDEQTNFRTIARKFGFSKIEGFIFYYERKKKII